ncbi:MAG TPA: KH domain-containing protein [Armatimonadetes bacterium]|nr:KH domain-containing protein [Armatimonadota bacterium]
MRELLEMIVKSLVDEPDMVRVTQVEGERTLIFEIRVAQSDLGKVIGKEGRIANAIRTLVKAAATKEGKKVAVEILP